MIWAASLGDKTPSAQADSTADEALSASAALSIGGRSKRPGIPSGRQQPFENKPKCGHFAFERLLQKLAGDRFRFAVKQRLDCKGRLVP